MHQVGRLIPALPVPLVATVLLAQQQQGDRAIDELELKSAVAALVQRLQAADAHTCTCRAVIGTMPSAPACAC